MIYKDFDYEYDQSVVVDEIMACRDLFFYIPPYEKWLDLARQQKVFMVESEQMYNDITYQNSNGIIQKRLKPPMSFYIKSSNFLNRAYNRAKKFDLGYSAYNPEIGNRLEYTKKIIENLPFIDIGLVRVFITENTFLPTHNDGFHREKFRNLGISLVPVHSETPLKYFDKENNKVGSIFSSAFLFDDSYFHGIPMVNGLRIDIRVFGNLKKEVEQR